jgi:hypothetical protein
MLRRSTLPLRGGALLALAASAHAQPYDASWWTVDGGGAAACPVDALIVLQ